MDHVTRQPESPKKQIIIRAHHLPFACIIAGDILSPLQTLFSPYGDIVFLQRHAFMGIPTTSCDFTLELSDESCKNPNLQLPRVAPIERRNVLFSWTGVHFCRRCGYADHNKANCPKPYNYYLSEVPAIPTIIWGRAFPRGASRPAPSPARPSTHQQQSQQQQQQQPQQQQQQQQQQGPQRTPASEDGGDQWQQQKRHQKRKGRRPTGTKNKRNPDTKPSN
ncbi:hypothetical protein BGZ73_000592 [Actinomortierella ambigua]|nr:hypothetical protein BGZ73_000592 [Actinomortierella ambigua]